MNITSKSIIKKYMPMIVLAIFIGFLFFRNNAAARVVAIIKPVLIAFAIAYVLDSVVKFLDIRIKFSRNFSIFFTYLLIIGLITVLISFLVPIIIQNFNSVFNFVVNGNFDFNNVLENLKNNSESQFLRNFFEYITDSTGEINSEISEQIMNGLKYISEYGAGFVRNIGEGILAGFTSFIISIYMLIEKDDLLNKCKKFTKAYFEENRANKIINTFNKGNKIFKSYFNGKILDSFIVGIIVIILFWIFGVPYAALMGAILGFTNMIPYFGPFFGSVPVIIVSLFIDPPKALLALIIILVVQQIDGNFLDPKIVGKAIGVSPFWVITAVTVGAVAAGPLGMILGVPTVVLIKTILEEDIEEKLEKKGIEMDLPEKS
ncbi:MAG: AI-2E family transporter [Eubacteriales bacterium]